jgi:hypothetical protein
MAHRLGERASFLLCEEQDSDPVWAESNASWRSWIEKTPGLDAQIVLRLRDEWRNDYAAEKRERQATNISFRKSSHLMRETDWDKQYQKLIKVDAKTQKQASFL